MYEPLLMKMITVFDVNFRQEVFLYVILFACVLQLKLSKC